MSVHIQFRAHFHICSEDQGTCFLQLPELLQVSQPEDERIELPWECPGHSCHVVAAEALCHESQGASLVQDACMQQQCLGNR